MKKYQNVAKIQSLDIDDFTSNKMKYKLADYLGLIQRDHTNLLVIKYHKFT